MSYVNKICINLDLANRESLSWFMLIFTRTIIIENVSSGDWAREETRIRLHKVTFSVMSFSIANSQNHKLQGFFFYSAVGVDQFCSADMRLKLTRVEKVIPFLGSLAGNSFVASNSGIFRPFCNLSTQSQPFFFHLSAAAARLFIVQILPWTVN